jgi:hypothetical protein
MSVRFGTLLSIGYDKDWNIPSAERRAFCEKAVEKFEERLAQLPSREEAIRQYTFEISKWQERLRYAAAKKLNLPAGHRLTRALMPPKLEKHVQKNLATGIRMGHPQYPVYAHVRKDGSGIDVVLFDQDRGEAIDCAVNTVRDTYIQYDAARGGGRKPGMPRLEYEFYLPRNLTNPSISVKTRADFERVKAELEDPASETYRQARHSVK